MIKKVCGMREGINICDVEALGIDWMGFIFYPKSPRYVSEKPAYLPHLCKRVGVFVNSSIDEVVEKAEDYHLDFVQLHSTESPAYCKQLAATFTHHVGIIKAVLVRSAKDFEKLSAYEPFVDYFLFDTHSASYGGSGQQFDWSLLDAYSGNVPFLLSGGISIDDAEAILQIRHPQFAGIDLNSKFEIAPGKKNIQLLNNFLNRLKI